MTRKTYFNKSTIFWAVLLAPMLFIKFLLYLFNDSGTDLSQFQVRLNTSKGWIIFQRGAHTIELLSYKKVLDYTCLYYTGRVVFLPLVNVFISFSMGE
ncbi:hypothetical protein LI951_07260 [Enterococcus sp. BWT-B8]|uniref:hypothetical protein n=1 Tax=Enterococcus sp. BWT-B8 TaxID=2885157 RepID=UPI001E2CF6C3|nr:hypothetical protein [Enterococcus sp. BWT-B8]MCB5951859.1 hypothetical protein [Enterococcus sp. BWT-B8]